MRSGLLALCGVACAALVTTACTSLSPTAEGERADDDAPVAVGVDPATNYQVSDLGGEQVLPRVVATADGGRWVSWFSNPDGSNYDVRLQYFDPEGRPAWDTAGLLVSEEKSDTFITDYALTTDADGNAVLVFQDIRSGSNDVRAYKVSPSGDQLWSAAGVAVSASESFEAPFPSTVATGSDLTIVWTRESGSGGEVVLQRLDDDGLSQWADDGVSPVSDGSVVDGQPVIVRSDDDDVIVVWGRSEDPNGDMTLLAQRVSSVGELVWAEAAVIGGDVPSFIIPSAVSDDAGGAYVAWNDIDQRGFVQRVGADGGLVFGDEPVPVALSVDSLHLELAVAAPTAGVGVPVFWRSTDAQQSEAGISGQLVTPDGLRAWGDDGLVVVARSSTPVDPPRAVAVGDAVRVAFSVGDGEEGGAPVNLARSVDVGLDDGAVGAAVDIASRPAERSLLESTRGDVGAVTYVWSERAAGSSDVFLQDTAP